LKDRTGLTVARAGPYMVPTSQWLRGQACSTSHAVKFSSSKDGDYQFALSLHDPVSKKAIALPLKDKLRDETYKMGDVRVATGFSHR